VPDEYPTGGGIVCVPNAGSRWVIEFNGSCGARWTSPDDVVIAAARHSAGLPEWDRMRFSVPDDLLRWRPLGDNLRLRE
jgi:hypothetical protein